MILLGFLTVDEENYLCNSYPMCQMQENENMTRSVNDMTNSYKKKSYRMFVYRWLYYLCQQQFRFLHQNSRWIYFTMFFFFQINWIFCFQIKGVLYPTIQSQIQVVSPP